MSVNLEELTKPFPREAIKQREGGQGRAFTYVEAYEAGASIREVAEQFGMSWGTARRRLLAAGVALRSNAEGTSVAALRSSLVRWPDRDKDTRVCSRCERDLPVNEFAMRSNGKWRRSECFECRRNASAMRRQLTVHRKGQVDYREVIERDGWTCYLCGDAVERGKHHFDHVVPLSRGGAHSVENVRVTHAFCNRSKGAKLVEVL